MAKNSLTHAQFAQHLFKISAAKEEIQKRLDEGGSVTELAGEIGIPITSMETLLDACEIKHGRAHRRGMGNGGPTVDLAPMYNRLKKAEADLDLVQTLMSSASMQLKELEGRITRLERLGLKA